MYPDLLEIFGVTLYGTVFERILWGIVCALMIWGLVSSVLIFRAGRRAEGAIQGGIVFGIFAWAGYQFFSTFSGHYVPVFSEPLVIHSYAFCILVGIGLGIWTIMKMAKLRGRSSNEMAKLCLWMIVIGFLGARAAHVIVEWSTYWNACFHPDLIGAKESNCLRVLNFAEGGLTFYGGVIAGFIVMAVFFVRRYRRGVPVEALSVMDMLGAALSITHAFGRLGCLAAGCCWGAVTTGTIGVRYDAGSFAYAALVNDAAYHDMMIKSGQTPLLHATQLYETCGELVLFGVLWWLLLRRKRHGVMAGVWLIGYGALRFVVEIMRDDPERGYFFEKVFPWVNELFRVPDGHSTMLSTSQGIAIGMIILGIAVLVVSAVLNEKKEVAGRMEPEAT